MYISAMKSRGCYRCINYVHIDVYVSRHVRGLLPCRPRGSLLISKIKFMHLFRKLHTRGRAVGVRALIQYTNYARFDKISAHA